jgi:uncharacterized protein involved in response to NO
MIWVNAAPNRREQTAGMDISPPAPVSPALSLRRLGVAPHRLMFFIGSSNLLLAMAWWAAWLVAARWPTLLTMHQPQPYAGWLHAFVMQYQMLPSFMFGFLMTTFPKWLGLPDLERWRYVPVGLGLFGGQLATLLGALGWDAGIVVGLLLTLGGWIAGLLSLGTLQCRESAATWHARSCFAALVLGFGGLLAWGAFVFGASPLWAFTSTKVGTFGLLLPMYLTVAHRMFPFFAARVMPGYQSWRPMWLVVAFWALCLSHLGLELLHAHAWSWLADVPLVALTATVLWRWWPTATPVGAPQQGLAITSASAALAVAGKTQDLPTPIRRPALLTVLFVGFAWLPVAFALYSAQSIAYLLTGVLWLGRAPAHALFIGFFGSVLIAMVTRVTQGHSGRPLVLPRVAQYAFVAIQLAAARRIAAELAGDTMQWQALAALGWLLALGPWVIWLGSIYLRPRVDGKAG